MHGLLLLLLQIALILALARLLGWAFRRIRQPQVIGEMVAGILLGPSLLGWLAPDAFAVLFPPESFVPLNTLSEIGLLFFMFLVGLELDPKLLRGRMRAAVITSQVSIVVPFGLGVALALYLHPLFSPPGTGFTEFALFIGAAMSVTAFPVLSRILVERNLLRTRVGTITIACAAVDDVSAWCILAGVIALVRAAGAEAFLVTLGGTILFAGFVIGIVRPGLRRLEAYYHSRGRITQDALAVTLLLLLASAWTTEWLGIHALFGAFLFGAVLPKDRDFARDLTEKLEDLTVVFLLPLFFAYTGLRTQIGLLDSGALWVTCGLIILVAVAGKFGGSTLAARATGLTWREAGALGVLMNTRGLMELIILTIGLELGVIPPVLFAMLVLMALATTFMTTPVLEWIYPLRHLRKERVEADEALPEYTVLIPVSLPSSGPELLRVARALSPSGGARYYGLHLARVSDHSLFDLHAAPQAENPLQPLLTAAEREGLSVRPLTFASRAPGQDIADVAHTKQADLIVMGWHKPVLNQSVLGGTVGTVMTGARADVAVYVARQFAPWQRLLVPFLGGPHDRGALDLAQRIARQSNAHLTILHVVPPERALNRPPLGVAALVDTLEMDQVRLKVVEHVQPLKAVVEEVRQPYDLVVVGATEAWGLEPRLFGFEHERLAAACPASLLIVYKYVPPAASPPVSAPPLAKEESLPNPSF